MISAVGSCHCQVAIRARVRPQDPLAIVPQRTRTQQLIHESIRQIKNSTSKMDFVIYGRLDGPQTG